MFSCLQSPTSSTFHWLLFFYHQTSKLILSNPSSKNPSLDQYILKNYRPISNLPFLSKILEKVVLHKPLAHLQENNLCSPFQSAYRAGHSSETALLRVVNDLLNAMDEGKISVLLLLDLSAAFDTIDHQILFSRLETVFGIRSTTLQWFRSYLLDRNQCVAVNNSASSSSLVMFGVPQGSVLGPVLFVLYTTPLSDIIANHSVNHQLFADDTQLQKINSTKQHAKPYTRPAIMYRWHKSMDVQQPTRTFEDKTEAILFSTPSLSSCHCLPSSIMVGTHEILFSDKVRNLGFILDSNLTMKQHVIKICQTAYYEWFICFCFVRLFSKVVFHLNFGFSGFVFSSLWAFLSLLSAFVGACSEAFLHLLLFTVVLPLFTFLVASLFRLLLFSVLTRASQGLFTLFCERFFKNFFSCFFFFFLLGCLPPSSFLTGSVLTSLQSMDPFTV